MALVVIARKAYGKGQMHHYPDLAVKVKKAVFGSQFSGCQLFVSGFDLCSKDIFQLFAHGSETV
jgi:hypothetical protein